MGVGWLPRWRWAREGINMGTRFCATKEAPIHDNVKAKYVENDERGTNLIFRKFHNTARVGKSEVSDEVVEISARPDSTFEDIQHLVKGAAGRELLESGGPVQGYLLGRHGAGADQ